MRTLPFFLLLSLLNLGCNAQESKDIAEHKEAEKQINEEPKGTWKVNKEFDENGNLIRFDSIYSWSSGNLEDLAALDKDSTLQQMRSKFYSRFSHFDQKGFEDVFGPDSLFTKHFFNDEFFKSPFGKDFFDLDAWHKQMENRQKEFLKKYRSQWKDEQNPPENTL
ncbi:hypothetical protein [Zobellia uliginosa]|uniref:hypothetical protein n=1 Tax=Zobellia uliginosa TaxID=143224 RepID=UPI0026E2A3FB|nr:hypothetical protein [Zobellia uliginosa]MDO6516633.1 hypothetical protein [Zobellia uliginosa]